MTRDEFLRAAGAAHDEWLAGNASVVAGDGNGFHPVETGRPSPADDAYNARLVELIAEYRS